MLRLQQVRVRLPGHSRRLLLTFRQGRLQPLGSPQRSNQQPLGNLQRSNRQPLDNPEQ
jgi:hypothetical protein